MQRLRETFRRRQPTLEQQAHQQHQQMLFDKQLRHQQKQQQQELQRNEDQIEVQIPPQLQEHRIVLKLRDCGNGSVDSEDELSVQQITLNVPQVGPHNKQIRSVSFDEIRLKESVQSADISTDSNKLDVPDNVSRNVRSRSFDSATCRAISNEPSLVTSTTLDVPKWKLLIRRSSSGSSSGSTGLSSNITYGFKDCHHCALMEEYLKATSSPPPSKSGSFSSEGSSICGDESEDASETDRNGSLSCQSTSYDLDEVEDTIEPLEGLPIVTLCPPPDIAEIHIHEEEEDTGSGITVVSLEVPVLSGSREHRSASVDSPYLLQVPQRTDIEVGETGPKAQRSRSVDIVLPTNPGGPYLIVPLHRQSPITTK